MLDVWLSPDRPLCTFEYQFNIFDLCLIVRFFLFLILVGIGYSMQYVNGLQLEPLEIEQYQIPISFTFNIDHSQEMFTKPLNRKIKKFSNAFDFFLLNFPPDTWQSFECPMVFSSCQYNWCVTGENPMVNHK